MSVKLKTLSQFSIGLCLATGLVACGGGGGDNTTSIDTPTTPVTPVEPVTPITPVEPTTPETDTVSLGNGNCVSFPRPTVNQRSLARVTAIIVEPSVSEVEVIVTAASDTSLSFSTAITGDIDSSGTLAIANSTGTLTQTFTIENNFQDVTETSTTNNIVTADGDIIDSQVTITLTPFQRFAVDEVCENQTWTTTFDSVANISFSGVAIPENEGSQVTRSLINTIESVDETTTVEAGTFNTFRLRTEDGNTTDLTWIDIASGITVMSEQRDNTGALLGTSELIE